MPSVHSAEIESVVRRVAEAWGDPNRQDTMASLVSTDPNLRVLGFDPDELWIGPERFLKVRQTQSVEMGNPGFVVDSVEGFEDGPFGWATLFATLTTPESSIEIRATAVLRLEAGVWRVVQWHNSTPVPNRQVFGIDLTTTLDELVASVLEDDTDLTFKSGPEGTMTLVFTDVVGSTQLTESLGDSLWAELIRNHETTIRRVTTSEGGTIVKFLGDGSMLAFDSARAAVRTAIRIQEEAREADLQVRIGVHTGEVMRATDDLFGLTVNKAARVAAAAQAGSILITSTTKDMIGSMGGVAFGEPQSVALKGLSGTHQVFPLEPTSDLQRST